MTTTARTPTAPLDAREAARLAWARNATGEKQLQLQRASVDAGHRSYWRAQTAAGSRIVMDSPPELEDVRPWLRMRALLASGGVRVPQVLVEDGTAGQRHPAHRPAAQAGPGAHAGGREVTGRG